MTKHVSRPNDSHTSSLEVQTRSSSEPNKYEPFYCNVSFKKADKANVISHKSTKACRAQVTSAASTNEESVEKGNQIMTERSPEDFGVSYIEEEYDHLDAFNNRQIPSASENVYGMEYGDTEDSVYNVTSETNNQRKTKLDNYDHVTISVREDFGEHFWHTLSPGVDEIYDDVCNEK